MHNAESRAALRKDIASDIYQTAERIPMTLTADGGETALLLAELALKRVEAAGYSRAECEFGTPAAAAACPDPTCRARGYGQPQGGEA